MAHCLFCEIARGNIPATILYQDENVVCFQDIKPQAPTHALVIPKLHIATIDDTKPEHQSLLGHMILTAKQIAIEKNINKNGYRLVFNVNNDGGQEVYHIHLHLLGGRHMTWPPG